VTAAWLVSDDGLDTVREVTTWLDNGEESLGIASRLRARGKAHEHSAAAIGAGIARRRARHRWADADRLLFTREALEQASDPEVSRWRAQRFAAAPSVMDLCAGVGGDTLALGDRVPSLTSVDMDPGRLHLLRHNAAVRGLDVASVVGDALRVDRPAAMWVHADPSRRDGSRRLRALRDHHPSVPALISHHRQAPGQGIVLSPAVDLDDPDLPDGELEFVALDGALTEAVVWIGATAVPGVQASATLLPSGHHRQRSGVAPYLPVGPVGHHLIEVSPAAVRARIHTVIGQEVGASRLAARRALLTADTLPEPSEWYRVRSVETVLNVRAKDIRRWLRHHDDHPLELASHGWSGDLDALWRAIGRPPRGPQGRRLDVVRLDDGAVAILSLPPPTGTRPSL
jgi:hypothetical protein